jgi:hypothetical protein
MVRAMLGLDAMSMDGWSTTDETEGFDVEVENDEKSAGNLADHVYSMLLCSALRPLFH